jgi:hypothetical protein
MGSVWIAGSYQSDFARNYAGEGLEISDMVAEAVACTLDRAGVAPEGGGLPGRRGQDLRHALSSPSGSRVAPTAAGHRASPSQAGDQWGLNMSWR